MMLDVDYRKSKVEIKKLTFKKEGVLIVLGSGESDLYKYSWLEKHLVSVE